MKLYVQDVGFSYVGAPALEHVTFCAMPGECTAVLGGNGAGKSTLLRCIDGILRCRQGRIEADGCPLDGMKPQKRARLIAYVPQEPQFPDGCTVFDAVLLGRTPYPEARKEDLSLVDGICTRLPCVGSTGCRAGSGRRLRSHVPWHRRRGFCFLTNPLPIWILPTSFRCLG